MYAQCRTWLALALVLLGLAVAPEFVAAQTKLAWKLTRGEKLNQEIVQAMVITMDAVGQNKTQVTQTLDMRWHVTEVDAQGVASIDQEITRIRMHLLGTGLDAKFDTDSQEKATGIAASFEPSLRALAKAKMTIKMSATGEILDAQVSDETMAAFQKMAGMSAMSGVFSKEGLLNTVKQGSPKLPAEAIEKGATWSAKMEVPVPQVGTMVVTNQMTYAGPVEQDGKKYEQIDLKLFTQVVPSAANSSVKMEIKEQSADGKLYFDNELGRLDHSELQQSMKMQIAAGGQVFHQLIDQTVKVRVIPAQ